MVARRPKQNETIFVERAEVVGEDSVGQHDRFVRHVGFNRQEARIRSGQLVSANQMGPPLGSAEIRVHVLGKKIPHTLDDIRRIESWFAERKDELNRPVFSGIRPWVQFIVQPHSERVRDKRTGVERFRKFSCVGLILDCYFELFDVKLIDVFGPDGEPTFSNLPSVPVDLLDEIYELPASAKILSKLGVDPTKGVQVVLPSYIFHSLKRTADAIRLEPFRVTLEHSIFP